jgi:L-ascorbate metabolism protein UlaG (beta-lactamase superfamily)
VGLVAVAAYFIAFRPGTTATSPAPVLRALQGLEGAGGMVAAVADRTPASFVLTSPQGVKVFLDTMVVPDDLQADLEDARNIFLASHDHADHLQPNLLQKFKGPKLRGGGQPVKEPGSVFWTAESGDVKVQAIASSHMDDVLDGNTNTIFVVDVAGVRVVHMGDCGQTKLTPEQLQAVGRPDVMIHLLEDVLNSEADVGNQKAYGLLAQVAPRMVIPTHVTTAPAVKLLDASYPAEIATRDELVLTPALLGGKKRAVFMGVNREVASKAGVANSSDL